MYVCMYITVRLKDYNNQLCIYELLNVGILIHIVTVFSFLKALKIWNKY